MTRKILTLLFVVASAGPLLADDDFNPVKSFANFRSNVLQDYSSFRDGILKDYDKFLEQAWIEYDKHRGEDRYSVPKPSKMPAVADNFVAGSIGYLSTPDPQPEAAPEPPTEEAAVEFPVLESPVKFEIDFFGIPVEIADTELDCASRLAGPKEYGKFWRSLTRGEKVYGLIGELQRTAADLQLNDYLTYELISKYVNQRYPDAHSSAQTALAHFILANMGFDARVAATDDGEGLLLLPFDRMVYARPYLTIDGSRYYVFCSNGSYPQANSRIVTYPLPGGSAAGASIGLTLTPLNIPVKNKTFNIAYGGLELTGEINENIFPIVYHYPQMDIGEYAKVNLDPELRRQLVGQLKNQLSSKPRIEAVNELLQFTQSAFDYATDDEAHGFEKPYFLEEILFYPQCDCEDRVIFYSYMLWNVLNVENQMITFPGHESAAVTLREPLTGDSYRFRGSTFYISDPTYIGAVTGQCMPDFRAEKPKLEYHYRK